MTYDQALAYWFGQIDYERRPLRAGDLKLDRMRELLAHLGDPQEKLRIVHIAGSKGKGSTAAMLSSVVAQARHRVGLFTSPHLSRVEERIQISGRPIVPQDLASCMEEIARADRRMAATRRTGGAGVTFFEIATALALLHFRNEKVDLAILEVGLGGRFDATNVCNPLVAVITSISHDHTKQLGRTLTAIAREKAGIVKIGRPTVCGARNTKALKAIEEVCRQRSSTLRRLGRELAVAYQPGEITSAGDKPSRVHITTEQRTWPKMDLGLFGEHQADNAALAVAAVEELRRQGFAIPDAAIAAGLANVDWPARLEVIGRQPLVILDCAHNRDSAEALVRALQTSIERPGCSEEAGMPPKSRRMLIFAASRDKDVPGMLQVLAPYFHDIFLTSFQNNPRCVPPERLAEMLRKKSSNPHSVHPDAADAWLQARAAAKDEDLICITGSVFLAGELRQKLIDDHASVEKNRSPR